MGLEVSVLERDSATDSEVDEFFDACPESFAQQTTAWRDSVLAVSGRLCLPVGGSHDQELLVLTREADGTLSRHTLAPVRFVPMTGEAQKR